MLTGVRRFKIQQGSLGDDAGGIDGGVTPIVMGLDMIHVHCFRHARNLIELAQIVPEIGIINQAPQIASSSMSKVANNASKASS